MSTLGLRPLRRRRPGLRRLAGALGAGAALAGLGGCGFNLATNQNYTPSEGTIYRDGVVDALNVAVVSAQPGSGTFVATFVNNSQTEAQRVLAVSPVSGTEVQVEGFTAVDVPAGGLVNLADDPSTVVTGDFIPGDFIEVSIDLETGDDFTMDLPVVRDEGFWDGLDISSEGGTVEPGPAESGSVEPSATESATE